MGRQSDFLLTYNPPPSPPLLPSAALGLRFGRGSLWQQAGTISEYPAQRGKRLDHVGGRRRDVCKRVVPDGEFLAV